MEANNSISFEYYCGRCCCPILKSGRFGYILSCSDFLCSGCHDGVAETITCPSCRNSGVRVLSMADSSSLPPEVCNKMADSDRRIEELLTGLHFQIKHYKTVLSRVTSRFGREKKEYLRYHKLFFFNNELCDTTIHFAYYFMQKNPTLGKPDDRSYRVSSSIR